MHRSGTSALAGVACTLGAAAPNNLLPANFANPSGYWESSPLVQATDDLLASAGSSWDDWRRLDPQWYGSDEAPRFRDRFQNIVKSEYDEKPLFVVKDPRLCRLMPFFLSVLKDMAVAPVALLSIRDPLEVALSLHRRDGFSISKSVALWLRHVLEAEFHSRQIPRCFISYENLLKDWRLEMGRASDTAGIAWPVDPETAAVLIERFLVADLHHERNESAEVEQHPDLLFLATETYDLLSAASRVGAGHHLLRRIDVIREKFDQASDFFGAAGVPAQEINDRARGLAVLNEELNGVVVKTDGELRRAVRAIEERDRQLATADGEMRRIMAELEVGNQRLLDANDELQRVTIQADNDLGIVIGEVESRDRQLAAADEEIRRLIAEVESRDRLLVAGSEEIRRVAAQADSDLRRAIGEMQERERQLVAADGEVRRLMAEVADRDQKLVGLSEELKRTAAQTDSDLRRAVSEIQERDRQLVAAAGEVRRFMAEVADRDQKLVGLSEELKRTAAQTDSDLRRAVGEIQERDRQLVAAAGEVRRFMAEVADRDQKLVGVSEELKRMTAQAELNLRDAIEEAGKQERRMSELRYRIHEIEMSTSWRITAPMRTLFSGWRHKSPRKKPPS
jgi:hypothetical protein